MALKLPAKTAPRKIRQNSTAAPSPGPRANTVKTVTMLARPSFTPGMGTGAGSCASTRKMVRAMAVSSANTASFLVFNPIPPSVKYTIQ